MDKICSLKLGWTLNIYIISWKIFLLDIIPWLADFFRTLSILSHCLPVSIISEKKSAFNLPRVLLYMTSLFLLKWHSCFITVVLVRYSNLLSSQLNSCSTEPSLYEKTRAKEIKSQYSWPAILGVEVLSLRWGMDEDFSSPPAQNKISETPDLGIMRNVGSLPLLSRYPNSSLGSVGRGRLVF